MCQVWSENGAIVQDLWMTIIAEYHRGSNAVSIKKNGVLIAGPAACTEAPRDRTIEVSYLGKSRFYHDDYFNGEMRELFIADKPMCNLTTVCDDTLVPNSSFTRAAYCRTHSLVKQRSFSAPHTPGLYIYPDEGSVEEAPLAVDGNINSCTRIIPNSGQNVTGWWQLDLEMTRLAVSVRLYGFVRGASIYVGNWRGWDKNKPCAINISTAHSSDGTGSVDVACQAEGRYLYIVQPIEQTDPEFSNRSNVSLTLCEVQVYGLSALNSLSGLVDPKCVACLPGFFSCFSHAFGTLCVCLL